MKHVHVALVATHFVPAPSAEEEAENTIIEEKHSFFEWNQHIRILLAMLVVFISAIALWWILV